MSTNPNPNLDRVERAYRERHHVGRGRAKASVRQGIGAMMEAHNVGYRDGIQLFADKHGFDVSVVADRRRRGALPLHDLLDTGAIAVGDTLRGYAREIRHVPARVGPGGTIIFGGTPYPDPIEAISAIGGVAYGVAAWDKWRHEPSKKTLLQLGVELIKKERQ